jgi:hypothetical protein
VSKHVLQRALCCPCGRQKVLALGLCPTCYTLRRQDEAHYAGNREKVLARDGYRCRIPGCQIAGNQKRTLAVHHRAPGNSHPSLMITLCFAHHAMVTRTHILRRDWPEILRILWREQHPGAPEQSTLQFNRAAE